MKNIKKKITATSFFVVTIFVCFNVNTQAQQLEDLATILEGTADISELDSWQR